MAQVLQDITDMAINFERSKGYSLPTSEVNQASSYNNCSSVNSHRSTKEPVKGIQQISLKTDKPKCWHCQGNHLKKDCPTTPQQSSSSQPKYHFTKERQCNLIKSFCNKFQDRKSQINEITVSSENNSFDDKLNQFFLEFENLMAKDTDDMST